MILVVGATGTNGKEVVQRLSATGQAVRALVRGPDKAEELNLPNVERVKGDLDDPPSVEAAMKGVDKAFVVTAVDPRAARWCQTVYDAAQKAGARHVVKFSGMGAGPDSRSEIMREHGLSDQRLIESGLAYTILRPNSFYQNMLWSAGSIKGAGEFYLPLGDAKQSLVDVRDIAAVAVAALTAKGHEGKVYDITGPQALSMSDVAATISRVLGRPVKYVSVPLQAAEDSMRASGMPAWNASAVRELYGVFATGQYARTTDTIEKVTGKKPITLEQFVREFAGAFS
jgi:uncharacterized protein YbjT (DUF2867 family)